MLYLIEECAKYEDIQHIMGVLLSKNTLNAHLGVSLMHLLIKRNGTPDLFDKNRFHYTDTFERYFSKGNTRYVVQGHDYTQDLMEMGDEWETQIKMNELDHRHVASNILEHDMTVFQRIAPKKINVKTHEGEVTKPMLITRLSDEQEWGLLYAGIMIVLGYHRLPSSIVSYFELEPATYEELDVAMLAITTLLKATRAG